MFFGVNCNAGVIDLRADFWLACDNEAARDNKPIWGVTSFSGTKAVSFCGSDGQKQEFLPRIASGKLKTAMSFTEAGGGTDLLGGMKSKVHKVAGGWVLNGEKMWSTGADVADYLLVKARTDMHPAKRSNGISIFFVPRTSKGITITPLARSF